MEMKQATLYFRIKFLDGHLKGLTHFDKLTFYGNDCVERAAKWGYRGRVFKTLQGNKIEIIDASFQNFQRN